jgi:hypothetical protein
MTIQVSNQKARDILNNMCSLQLIKVLDEKTTVLPTSTKLSAKYRGVFSKEDAQSFDAHCKTIRNEWNDI